MSTPTKRKSTLLSIAFRCFWSVVVNAQFARQAEALLDGEALPAPVAAPAPTPAAPAAPPKPSGEALRLLALLQRDGRLVDFLMEDIANLPDAQIGAAVKSIHRDCRRVLQEHVTLDTVVEKKEDEAMTVQAGYDPATIRLTGNLTGQPPYTGTVKHRGWKAKEIKLPPPPPGAAALVLEPAEVELA